MKKTEDKINVDQKIQVKDILKEEFDRFEKMIRGESKVIDLSFMKMYRKLYQGKKWFEMAEPLLADGLAEDDMGKIYQGLILFHAARVRWIEIIDIIQKGLCDEKEEN